MAPSELVQDGTVSLILCLIAPVLGVVFSYVYYRQTAEIVLDPQAIKESGSAPLVVNEDVNSAQQENIWEVYNLIYNGAHSFLYAEYRYIGYFMVIFSVIIFVVLGISGGGGTFDDSHKWENAIFTTIAFVVGGTTSVFCGFLGMKIGVFANARTAVKCQQNLEDGFATSVKAAIVMGFCLCSFGVLNLLILVYLYRLYYSDALAVSASATGSQAEQTQALFEAIAGYGLGGSSIALFGRVGGGIYTKAADVGADLVGKVEAGIPEDDPRNPAVIADNVGDNVGDIAGMGADLFGSFAEATCAGFVIASQTASLQSADTSADNLYYAHWGYVSFPLVISATGILTCFFTSFIATHVAPARRIADIEPTLKRQLLFSTFLMTGVLLAISMTMLPSVAYFNDGTYNTTTTPKTPNTIEVQNWHVFVSAACGLWSGLIIGYVTEYYTSNRYAPVQEVAESCNTGAATNIIYGLALGYKSVIVPAACLAFTTFIAHSLAAFYGVAMAALGILSTLSIGLTIDAFGPICDNAGGIAEMCEMGEETRNRTDALDAAGNTTAAIGKGFAIGSAAFVSLALFSGFITIVQNKTGGNALSSVDLLQAWPFAGLLLGAMLPYWFSAMTMKSVGMAAFEMVQEVRQQFADNPGILTGETKPNYDRCIRISTEASLYEMIFPGMLVILTPLISGFLFGVDFLAGVLAGALVSGVQMAISSSNTGGAWDNAKKYIEQGLLGQDKGKGSDCHKAAVVGDTVGDPLKDTSGPSLNILIKLMAIISLVFARAFPTNTGGWLGELYTKIK